MEKIRQRVAELVKIANTLWPNHSFDDLTVKMNNRLTSTAGRAWLQTGLVEFSTSLYEANTDAFMEDTIPHEVAHIIAYRVYGSSGHDAAWKQVCYALGSNTSRLHSFKTNKNNGTAMRCGCMTHYFSPQRMAWVRKGKVYSCKHCNQILVKVE